jgi:hypothetical protein
MQKMLLVIVLSLFYSVVYSENRIFVDIEKKLEVVDMDGVKTPEQINEEFKGDFKDITTERKAKEEVNKIIVKENAEKEALIQAKIREQAISELKKEGKLDNDGNVVK